MKYKRLQKEELQELEKEFIRFLSSAQITGADWGKMKVKETEKAEELIEVFSDLVYEKVLSKIKYLEYRDEKILTIFCCLPEKILLAGITVKEGSSLSLLTPGAFKTWNEKEANDVNIIKSERTYLKDRGSEVFELLQKGCVITDDYLFNVLNNIENS
ncbi:MAG: hypothetical protein H0X46_04030 [Bacteroidetes bacterium]|nr:hypothetical protein [Bacteroidota bacterium]